VEGPQRRFPSCYHANGRLIQDAENIPQIEMLFWIVYVSGWSVGDIAYSL
jgi:hypothetical protein